MSARSGPLPVGEGGPPGRPREPHLPTPSGELQLIEQHGVPAPSSFFLFRPLHALDRWLGQVELLVLILLLAAMMILGTAQVVMREVFNTGLPWADPLLRNMVLWAGMVGAMVATQSGRHLNMDALARMMPVGVRRWVDILVNLAASVTCGYLVQVSIPYLQEEIAAESEAIVGGLLPWHVQLIFPIAFAVMAFRFGLFALDGLAGLIVDAVKALFSRLGLLGQDGQTGGRPQSGPPPVAGVAPAVQPASEAGLPGASLDARPGDERLPEPGDSRRDWNRWN